jgi:hypothetical protein
LLEVIGNTENSTAVAALDLARIIYTHRQLIAITFAEGPDAEELFQEFLNAGKDREHSPEAV